MFERFTERARQVVVLAQEEARALKHDYIGTEHLLLGLLRVEEGMAAKVLQSFGVSAERVRADIERLVGRGEAERAAGQIPFSPRAKKVLELGLREALTLGHDYIGTEHILLGLVRESEGAAARILLDFDIDAEVVHAKLYELLGGMAQTALPRRSPRFRRASFEVRPANQWEYRLEHADEVGEATVAWLNSLGAEGWELVTMLPKAEGVRFVFKRLCRPATHATG